MVVESEAQSSKLQDRSITQARHHKGIEPNAESSTHIHKDANNMFDLLPSRKDTNEQSKGGQRTVQIDDSQDSEDSLYEAPKANRIGKVRSTRSAKNVETDETSQNLTLLSFLEVRIPHAFVIAADFLNHRAMRLRS